MLSRSMNKQWMLSLSQLFYSGYASGHRGRWDLEYHVTSAHPTTMLLSSLQAVCPASGNQSFGWFKSIIAVTFPLARNWSKMEVHVCETHVWPMRWMRCKGKCTRDSRKDCSRGYFSILDTISENMMPGSEAAILRPWDKCEDIKFSLSPSQKC